VRYFDQNNGVARFRAFVGSRVLAEWTANDRVPTRKIDSSASALYAIDGIALRPGDEIRIEGTPDGGETAALDYVEVVPNEN
jgi:alpha-glucuronidase